METIISVQHSVTLLARYQDSIDDMVISIQFAASTLLDSAPLRGQTLTSNCEPGTSIMLCGVFCLLTTASSSASSVLHILGAHIPGLMVQVFAYFYTAASLVGAHGIKMVFPWMYLAIHSQTSDDTFRHIFRL